MINIKLKDGNIKTFEKPITIYEVSKNISISLSKNVVAGLINNELKDINYLIISDCDLNLILKSDNPSEIYNATFGYYIALYLNQKYEATIYNIISKNDYFDVIFDSKIKLNTNDLINIKKDYFKFLNSLQGQVQYSNELNQLNEFSLKTIENNKKNYFIYKYKNTFIPTDKPITNKKYCKFLELNNISGQYFLNDANNKMVQAIRGFGEFDQNVFDQKIKIKEELMNSDHRKMGKELELFMFSNEVGAGLPIWLPRGMKLKRKIEDYIRLKEKKYNFLEVQTPILGTKSMYEKSGHLAHYKDTMFNPIEDKHESLYLRPMACPHHITIYKNNIHSYKELPIRYSEQAIMHRYEASGALTGLERVRMMTLTDAHIFIQLSQVKNEFKRCYELIKEVLDDFNINIEYLSLSCRDKTKDKYYDDDKMWNESEKILEDTLKELNLKYKKVIGEAAFYGPKLDIQILSNLGHEITISTLQLDFLLANKFNVNYIDKDNNNIKPVIIHRGLIGTYERFISILLEQTKGKLPLWISPLQVEIIPVTLNKFNNYIDKLENILKDNNIDFITNNKEQRLSYKIRESQIKKINYQLIIGEEEVQNNTVNYRKLGKKENISIQISDFIKLINKKIKEKS